MSSPEEHLSDIDDELSRLEAVISLAHFQIGII